jgi:radical SAM superfamily enzyme YgiQ (UPF0313 family)
MNPEQIKREKVKINMYMDYLPYGFLILSAAIRLFNPEWKVIIVDLNLEFLRRAGSGQPFDFDTVLSSIPDGCDLYGVSWMFASIEQEALRVFKYLKSKEQFVVAGGTQSTADYIPLLKNGYAEIVFKRESETQINRVLSLWEESINNETVPTSKSAGIVNLAFNSDREIVSFNDSYEKPVVLDIRGEYDKLSLDAYHKYGSPSVWCRTAAKGRKFATIPSTKGCRGRCIFCAVTGFMGHGARCRNPQDVLDEIWYLYNEKGVRHIEWLDDDLLADRDCALMLFNKLAALKLDLTWTTSAYVLALSIDEEIANAMVNSGCVMTGFGVETGNADRLRTLRKPSSLEKLRKAAGIFKSNHPEILLISTIIFGYPEETFRELMDTYNFVEELKLDWCTHSLLQPLADTDIFYDLQRLGDERTLTDFGKSKIAAFTIGREAINRGFTFDDIFKDITDFRTFDLDKFLSKAELQQFQIYFNVFVNLIGNVNLTSRGRPEKIRRHTEDFLKRYPMDPVLWAVNAKAAEMLGLTENYEYSRENYEIALKNSSFWQNFFEVYDIPQLLELPIR